MVKEFFGIGGYTRKAEGFLSWQHLAFVSFLMVCMVVLAVALGKRNRPKGYQACNRVLKTAALLMVGTELLKILLRCILWHNWMAWLDDLPLYMCSIQLITLPLAAFCRGRLKESSLDFVCIFGVLGAVMGTYGAGNNYACYPVLSFDNVVSGITHTIAGFASIYIMVTGMAKMEKRNICITFATIIGFSIAAYVVNTMSGSKYNYMFLMRGDGTPYDILFNLVSGHKVWYPLGVVLLFIAYIALFYVISSRVGNHKKQKEESIHECSEKICG